MVPSWTSSILASRPTWRSASAASTSRCCSRWRPQAERARLPDRRAQRRRHARGARPLRRGASGSSSSVRGSGTPPTGSPEPRAERRGPLHRRGPGERVKAADYLSRAGLADRVRFHVGDAVAEFGELEGEFDVDLQRHRQGRVSGRLACRQRADPARRPLRLRQHPLVRQGRGRRPGRHSSPVHRGRPRAQPADRGGRALPLDDRAHPRRRHGGDPDRAEAHLAGTVLGSRTEATGPATRR